MKLLHSINPTYGNIWCYKSVQSDRCIFIRLYAISICTVIKPSKGIQQVRWEMNFHHHFCLHLMISGICQKQKKLIKLTPAALLITSLPLKHRTCTSQPCTDPRLAAASNRTTCCQICWWLNWPNEILLLPLGVNSYPQCFGGETQYLTIFVSCQAQQQLPPRERALLSVRETTLGKQCQLYG